MTSFMNSPESFCSEKLANIDAFYIFIYEWLFINYVTQPKQDGSIGNNTLAWHAVG